MGKPRIVQVDVTGTDIGSGTHDCAECPLARALSRALGTEVRVLFGPTAYARVLDGADNPRVFLPAECDQFVRDYDSGHPVHPFSFRLDASPVHA